MTPRRRKRTLASAPAKAEAVSPETSHDDFDAREYFLALAPSYTDWPNGAVREFEEEGFIGVRLTASRTASCLGALDEMLRQ